MAENQHFAFARTTDKECYICLINNGESEQTLHLPMWQLGIESGSLHSVLSDTKWSIKEGDVSVILAGKEGLLVSVEK